MTLKISSYLVRCMHTDKESTYFDLALDKVDEFLEKMRTNNIFWYSKGEIKDNGFWVNANNIRFVQFTTIEGAQNDSTTTPMQCDGDVCLQKDADSKGKKSTPRRRGGSS